uniref:calcineurin-like phosphoesterase C-terminal domain-containing protein n=1 Tax=Candidatus Cryptobacteroides bacterium TaxID=3085639 RepID=UPI00402A2B98
MTGDKSLKYTLLTLALALTCALVGSVRLSGADGGGNRQSRCRVLRVALVGDPQVDDSTEMGYARRSVYRELYGRRDLDMCIFLGDLVNDNMSLLPESVGVIDSLPYQCFMVPGNHDRDVYRGQKSSMFRQRDLSTWRKAVGYVDTSFVRGNVRFVLMNNVRPSDSGMTDYVGGFTDRQKHWLDSVLNRGVGETRGRKPSRVCGTPALTILATHIPFSQMKGRDSVLALIPDISRLLFVSGHTHFVSRDDSIPELIVGAACGSWWRGVRDSDGIPYALQSCGAPRGYFIADIHRDGTYDLSYKCIGRPASEQLSAWAVPNDSTGRSYRLYINVFGGSSDGVVRISGLGRKTYSCERSLMAAPEVEQVIRLNASRSRDYRKSHRDEFIPLRRKPSPHLWQTTDLISGPLPAHVNVIYRDAHMRIRQRVPLSVYVNDACRDSHMRGRQ